MVIKYDIIKNMGKKHTTVGSNTYEAIKHDIIFGQLTPDLKLKLGTLKNQYEASVSTLRESLGRLACEGFVVAQEQRGFFVAPVSKGDLIEIANLRILLEKQALKESIKKGDTEWEADVVAAYHKLNLMEKRMQEGDLSEKKIWKQYDWEFHQAMIKACNSINLLQIHAIIYDKYLRYQMQVLDFRGQDAATEHKNMLDAALARDSKGAQKILEDHIISGLKHSMTAF